MIGQVIELCAHVDWCLVMKTMGLVWSEPQGAQIHQLVLCCKLPNTARLLA